MSESKLNEYQCASCGGVFDKGWSDEEAEAELSANFPGFTTENSKLVCDDCYKAMMRHDTKTETK